MKGYTGRMLEVNLTTNKITEIPTERYLRDFIGGRGVAAKILYDNVRPKTNPLSEDNLLICSSGPLSGTSALGSSRTHFTFKSPLTGIYGSSNGGGHFSAELKYAGFDAVIVRGKSEKPCYIYINNGRGEIKDAGAYWGENTFSTGEKIKRDLSESNAQLFTIGQAGENLVKVSSIITTGSFLEGKAAARCGGGAVMGSKKLKAIVVRGTMPVEVSHPEKFQAEVDDTIEILKSDPASAIRAPKYGTTQLITSLGKSGSLVTNNYQIGKFDREVDINGDTLNEEYFWKAHACFSCWLRCCRYVTIDSGPFKGFCGKGPEFETLSMLGSNVGIGRLDAIIKLGDECDAYGMDTISVGNTIAFAMELYQRGILTKEDADGLDLRWGNYEAVMELIKKMALLDGFGKILSEGVRRAAEIIGRGSEKYAMHTKGLEHIGGDPRGQTGFTLGYATCTRGADHLGALPIFEYMGKPEEGEKYFGSAEAANRFGVKGKGRLVKWQEDLMTIEDCLIVCKAEYSHNASSFEKVLKLGFEKQAKLYEYATGIEMSPDQLQKAGERIWNLEKAFNVREGMTRKDDNLPERFLKEPLKEGGSAGNLVNLEPMLDEYYEARGWDVATGIPKREKLVELGLEYVANDLEVTT
jgi:aldehyde:ferredoxin oxidoreductase